MPLFLGFVFKWSQVKEPAGSYAGGHWKENYRIMSITYDRIMES